MIIDENEELVTSMSMTEKLKENITLNGKEAKEYENWKVRNIRTLNLKEGKVKETVKSGPFEKFCVKKGLEREKGLWERMAKKEI